MIAIILKDSSKTWYGKMIGEIIEVKPCINNDRYVIHTTKIPGQKFPKMKYLKADDLEFIQI